MGRYCKEKKAKCHPLEDVYTLWNLEIVIIKAKCGSNEYLLREKGLLNIVNVCPTLTSQGQAERSPEQSLLTLSEIALSIKKENITNAVFRFPFAKTCDHFY